MIKVCYIPHGRDYYKIRGIVKFLPEEEFSFSFVTKHRSAQRMHKNDGFESYYIGGIFEEKSNFSEEELRQLDLTYGPHGMRAIANSDLYIPYLCKTETERDQLVARAYKFWEEFFAKHKFDYVLVNDTGSVDTRTAYNVVKTMGRPPIGKISIGPKYDQFTICDVGEELCWSELLDALSMGPKPLTQNQRKFVDDFLEVRHAQTQFVSHAKPLFDIKKRALKFKTLAKTILAAKLRKQKADMASAKYSLSKLIRKTWWLYFTRNFFQYAPLVEGERFVYYPIFYTYEIMKKALHYYWTQNQLSLIKEVADSLPAGIKLYVKEHPGAEGNSSFAFLNTVKKIPNVKIINPYVTGQELIQKCEAVVNLDGTSGWEAYLRQKPVVNMTPLVYFARSPLVYKVGSPCELTTTLFLAIQNGSRIYKEKEQEWLWFIYCAISTCGKGIYLGDSDRAGNYESMAQYIGEKIRRATAPYNKKQTA